MVISRDDRQGRHGDGADGDQDRQHPARGAAEPAEGPSRASCRVKALALPARDAEEPFSRRSRRREGTRRKPSCHMYGAQMNTDENGELASDSRSSSSSASICAPSVANTLRDFAFALRLQPSRMNTDVPNYPAGWHASWRRCARRSVDALVLTPGADLFYLTGFTHGHAGERLLALVVRARDGRASWIVPRMNVEQVSAHAKPADQAIRSWTDAEGYSAGAARGARRMRVDRVRRRGAGGVSAGRHRRNWAHGGRRSRPAP